MSPEAFGFGHWKMNVDVALFENPFMNELVGLSLWNDRLIKGGDKLIFSSN